MKIKITSTRYPAPKYAKGTEHEVAEVIPHGGYTDAACQYVLADGWIINGDYAEEKKENPGNLALGLNLAVGLKESKYQGGGLGK